MAISEKPVSARTYYSLYKKDNKDKLEKSIELKEELLKKANELRSILNSKIDYYEFKHNIKFNDYKEFIENKYIDGTLLKVAKSIFLNRGNDYQLVPKLYDILEYAQTLSSIKDIEKVIVKYKKVDKITYSEYINILNTYYTEVHKQLILEGNGYSLGNIGWICINRVYLRNRKKQTLDFAATKKREAELKAQGKRIWNKEEAEWCAKNGIEYIAEDKRVFMNDEYIYEIPLIDPLIKGGYNLKLEIADYRGKDVRGKTNDELLESCNGDLNKVCELGLNIKTKLSFCNKLDKKLYLKFIRNESQHSVAYVTASSKNR